MGECGLDFIGPGEELAGGLVNTVMSLRILKRTVNILTLLSASQKGLPHLVI
jgi:hypothetical protein